MTRFLSLIVAAVLITAIRAAERDITVVNNSAGITLAGTLSTPEAAPPRGVIVMITGSGAQDRDETIMGHRPFKTIADSLSAHGWATLRTDDRGTGSSTGQFKGAKQTDFMTDVAATIVVADSLYGGLPLGLLGHSEGGQIAYRLAAATPRIDFIVTLAAPAWQGDSIVMSQSRALAVGQTGKWDGEPVQRQILDIVKSDMPDVYARIALIDLLGRALGEMAQLPEVQRQLSAQVDVLLSPWYREFIRYNPAEDIAAVTVPWLALNGSKDTQVLPANLGTIASLNPGVKTIELPGLNHLFQRCTTGLVTEYATAGQTMTDNTINLIVNFLDLIQPKSTAK